LQEEDGIRDWSVTGVQTCALPICHDLVGVFPARAERGRAVFEANCARCHGTYGPGGEYPNKIVTLDVIGTDPARAKGLTDRFIRSEERRVGEERRYRRSASGCKSK